MKNIFFKTLITIFIIYFLFTIYYYKKYDYSSLSNYKIYEIKYNEINDINIFNSCITKEENNYIIYARIDDTYNKHILDYNYKCITKKSREEYLGKFIYDKNFNLIDKTIENCKDYVKNMILEDFRVFFYNGKKYMIGTCCEEDYYTYSKTFYPIIIDYEKRFNNNNIIKIVDENGKKFDGMKNFIPFIEKNENELYLIKNHNPLEIGKMYYNNNNENNTYIYKNFYKGNFKKHLPNLRGNTLYLHFSYKKYIGIVHDSFKNKIFPQIYRHYLVILNFEDKNNPYIEKISKPICLTGECGIEFVMGFVESYDKKEYIITFGKEDKESYIIVIKKENLLNYFIS